VSVFCSILLSCLLLGGLSVPGAVAGPGAAQHLGSHQLGVGLDLSLRSARQPAAGLPSWQQRAELTAPDGVAGDHLGGPVALSGDTALLGAWDKNHGTGAAYIFVRQNGSWSVQAELRAGNGKPGDWFGVSVALSGNTALVGAPLAGHSGAAYVFTRNGSGWTQQARLTCGVAGAWFGRTVALSGETALVGAWYEHNHAGAAYAFVRAGNRWTQQAGLTAGDEVEGDFFGTSVALNGDTALIGAAGKDNSAGAAYVFARHGSRWLQQAELIAGNGRPGDTFGTATALSDGTALVGAGFANSNAGAAYVFVRQGGRWTKQTELTALGSIGSWFARAVALSGDTALVGAWYEHNDTGAAYIFVRQGSHWTQQARLTASDGAAEDYFGGSVALSQGTALVGAGFRHHGAGAVYVFSLQPALAIR
jgi:hypothetical protein